MEMPENQNIFQVVLTPTLGGASGVRIFYSMRSHILIEKPHKLQMLITSGSSCDTIPRPLLEERPCPLALFISCWLEDTLTEREGLPHPPLDVVLIALSERLTIMGLLALW